MRIEIYSIDENGREKAEVSRLSGEDELRSLAHVVGGMRCAERRSVGDLMEKIHLAAINEEYHRRERKREEMGGTGGKWETLRRTCPSCNFRLE